MGEGVEGGFAPVGPLPRIAYAAKSEGWDRAVEESVVDGGAAGGYLVKDCELS